MHYSCTVQQYSYMHAGACTVLASFMHVLSFLHATWMQYACSVSSSMQKCRGFACIFYVLFMHVICMHFAMCRTMFAHMYALHCNVCKIALRTALRCEFTALKACNAI